MDTILPPVAVSLALLATPADRLPESGPALFASRLASVTHDLERLADETSRHPEDRGWPAEERRTAEVLRSLESSTLDPRDRDVLEAGARALEAQAGRPLPHGTDTLKQVRVRIGWLLRRVRGRLEARHASPLPIHRPTSDF